MKIRDMMRTLAFHRTMVGFAFCTATLSVASAQKNSTSAATAQSSSLKIISKIFEPR
jgi:hypothetical protein